MTTPWEVMQTELRKAPRLWLVTGAAGFIGSHLVEALLKLNQHVIGLDNLATGYRHNLEEVQSLVSPKQWAHFRFEKGDVCRMADCHAVCAGVDYVLHQAALGSVPRSVQDPLRSHVTNVDGFVNVVIAARDAKVRRFVYASSSSVYGDHAALPKVEINIGQPLSPYAVTKFVNEVYAGVFARTYDLRSVGLRYFNVFGPRQDAESGYAAVIPKWFAALLQDREVVINGDGESSRDFCYVDNVVQANILAATSEPVDPAVVLNVAVGECTTLNKLFVCIRDIVGTLRPAAQLSVAVHRKERAGDVRHSLANIDAARKLLGYSPEVRLQEGLRRAFDWYRISRPVKLCPGTPVRNFENIIDQRSM